ncbi:uncharacterized protein [Aegilops tauschii subsp. strangulata]|uniref:uncharacterized protein n=1 Tax=Aegilops tauschii subsp. strangulata TaxID=200361 RepID=UPI003CC879CA
MQLWSRPAKTLPIALNGQAIVDSLTENNKRRVWASRMVRDDQLYIIQVQGIAGITPPTTLVVKKFQNMNPALQVDDNVQYRYISEMFLGGSLPSARPKGSATCTTDAKGRSSTTTSTPTTSCLIRIPLGNFGYAAPEYGVAASELTETVDTYSFGVLMLELVTGRMANEAGADGHLATWARNNFTKLMANQQEMFQSAVDRDIPDQAWYMEEMATVFMLGVDCTVGNPQKRPSMRMALKRLRGGFVRGPLRGLLSCYLL